MAFTGRQQTMKSNAFLLQLLLSIGTTMRSSANRVTSVVEPPLSVLPETLTETSLSTCSLPDGSCLSPNNHSDARDHQDYKPEPDLQTASLFSVEQHKQFDRDGFVIVSGLLDEQLADFVQAGQEFSDKSKKSSSYFSIIDMGLIFEAGKTGESHITKAFRRVVFQSKLPQAVAELMRLPPTQNVRVLRYVRCPSLKWDAHSAY